MNTSLVTTGIAGLDHILNGGFISKKAYLVRGGPGTGKTTLGLHFLKAADNNSLLVTLMEPEASLRASAESISLSLEKTEILDLSPEPEYAVDNQSFNVFPSGEVEQQPLMDQIVDKIRELEPEKIFLDGLKQLRYLAPDIYQYRKQVLSLIKYAVMQGATVLISSEAGHADSDEDLQFICDGVLELKFENEMRFISVAKLRGADFKTGAHSLIMSDKGMQVYPKVAETVKPREFERETIPSGVPELDELLHGGLERGTDTIISGPTGVGKTSLGLQFMKEAAGRGERSVVYTFEEGREAILERSKNINIPIESMQKHGTLSVVKISPFSCSPEEFENMIRSEVEENKARIVMLDSVNSYFTTFYRPPYSRNELIRRLHILSEYLKNMGVTVLKIAEVSSVTGDFIATEYEISYMADNIVFLRFYENHGRLHKAVGVLKKRLSNFEKTLRRFEITEYGIKVGRPLENFRGILTGNPELSHQAEAEYGPGEKNA